MRLHRMHKVVIPLIIIVLIIVVYSTAYVTAPSSSQAPAQAPAAKASDKFRLFSARDNPGGDLVPASSQGNFGVADVEVCARRCLDNPDCHSFGYDSQYYGDPYNATGYCTLKSHTAEPKQPWSATGIFGLKL